MNRASVRRPLSRRLATLLIAGLAAVVIAPPPAIHAQQGSCEFNLGFETLHEMIPQVVGQCVENEHHNPANGDALQRTTNGLLVWRKADNWTAFTDGSTTWINGPMGLQSRPNDERFAWEPAQAPIPTPIAAPASAPAPAPVPPPQVEQPTAPPPGPVQKLPGEVVLDLSHVGKEITRVALESGSDDRGTWTEVRYLRGPESEYVNAGLGPLKIYNRAYVAKDVPTAQAIYNQEVERQRRLPEAQDTFNAVNPHEPQHGVVSIADAQNTVYGCNDDCNTRAFNRLHQRAVLRNQNVVTVLYFWGSDGAADVDQLNEWLRVLTDRMQ